MNIKFVKRCCSDDIKLIENFEKALNDTSQIWDLHHRLEIELQKTAKELVSLGLYFKRPASELIFLPHNEHSKLHQSNDYMKHIISYKSSGENNSMFGKHHSEETIEKMRIAKQGENHPRFGKHCSIETKQKMRLSARKPKEKHKWMTPTGEIKFMSNRNARVYHPDWKLIKEET